MFTTTAQQEFKATIKAFSQQKFAEYGTHAYSAGYLESLVVDMFGQLSKRQQKMYLESLQPVDNTAK